MQENFPRIVLILMLLALCGTGLILFRARLQLFWGSMCDVFSELLRPFTTTDVDPSQADHTEHSSEQTLPCSVFQYKYLIPLVLTICFILFFVLLQSVLSYLQSNDSSSSGAAILLGVGIIALLGILIIAVYYHYEKNPRRRFWLGLLVTLALEAGVVFDLLLFLNGYYFREARQGKRLVYALLFIPVFLGFCLKTQRDWQTWQHAKYSDSRDATDCPTSN